MPRACKTCGRVVAEATYCPFCSEPTIEYVPVRRNRRDAMTIRREFEQRKGWIAIVSLISYFTPLGIVFFQILFGIDQFYPILSPFIVIALISFFTLALYIVLYERSYAFPCPRCAKNIDLKAIGKNVRYCPFCGMDLDVEIDPESDEPTGLLKEEWNQQGFEIKKTAIQLSPAMQKGNTAIQLPAGKEETQTREEKKETT